MPLGANPLTLAASSSAPPQDEVLAIRDDPNLPLAALGVVSPTVTPTPVGSQTPIASVTATPGGATPTPTARPGSTSTPTPRPGSTTPTPTTSTAATTAAAVASSGCDTTQSPIFCVYTIQGGDTLSAIASKFGLQGNDDVVSWQLLVQSNKPDITSENDILQPGQKLRIPTNIAAAASLAGPGGLVPTASGGSGTGGSLVHTVLSTETLIDIANKYGVGVSDIVSANKLANPDALSIGQDLLIPNPKQLAKPAPAAAPGSSSGSSSPASVPVGAKSNVGFIWPVSGPISSYMSASHPLGIDVDLYGSPNAPIGSVAAGTVTFAGGNSCCSYGLYVIVDHGNGFQTLYAHLSKVSVSAGQRVFQGQVIGAGGRTGYATGNHLHFEVHKDGNIVNPLSYLP